MANTLTCPVPSTINPLSGVSFKFNITKLPELTYFCQATQLPQITIPDISQASPFMNPSLPGDKMHYGDLVVEFLIDENMTNYVAIHDWMYGLGFPEDWSQYTNLLNQAQINTSELQKNYSDATLQILNSSNNVVKTVSFVDVHPTSLSAVQFDSRAGDIQYLVGVATFAYSYYEFI